MFRGSLVALVTPMTDAGDVDPVAFGRLLDWHRQQGSDGIVVAGTTGESPTVTAAEVEELLRIAVQRVGGHLPVIAGTGGGVVSTVRITSLEGALWLLLASVAVAVIV